MMKNLLLMLILSGSFSAIAVEVEQVEGAMTKTYWIDTRTQEEFDRGAVQGAVLIPFDVIDERIGEVTMDKNADIRVYCRSGRRSGIAKDTLNSLGYQNVINEGGYQEVANRRN